MKVAWFLLCSKCQNRWLHVSLCYSEELAWQFEIIHFFKSMQYEVNTWWKRADKVLKNDCIWSKSSSVLLQVRICSKVRFRVTLHIHYLTRITSVKFPLYVFGFELTGKHNPSRNHCLTYTIRGTWIIIFLSFNQVHVSGQRPEQRRLIHTLLLQLFGGPRGFVSLRRSLSESLLPVRPALLLYLRCCPLGIN